MISWLIFCSLLCHAQGGDGKSLSFDESRHDFGTIEETAGPVSHRFCFVNRSEEAVFLTAVIPGCSCTTADYRHVTVQPGSTGEIKVTYDPASLPGPFRQNVLVKASDRTSCRLVIEGTVKERDRGRDEKYPYFLADNLQAEKIRLRFGFVPGGTVVSRRIGIVNTSGKTISLSWEPGRRDDGLVVTVPETLMPDEESGIEVTFDLGKGRLGTLDNTLTVSTGEDGVRKAITIEGYAVYTIEDSPGAASFRFEPTMVSFGNGRKKASVRFYNDGAQDLRILKTECPEGIRAELPEGTAIPGGGSIAVPLKRTAGGTSGSIRVFTNDPHRPVREIIIK